MLLLIQYAILYLVNYLLHFACLLLLTNNSIIKILAGEMGYYKVSQPFDLLKVQAKEMFYASEGKVALKKEVVDAYVDKINQQEGIVVFCFHCG